MNKKQSRLRRAKRSRMMMLESQATRLCVYRSAKHIYAQIIQSDGAKTLACASTLDKDIKGKVESTGNVDAARLVGKLVAKRALEAGITTVAFDRSGYKYHGRIKALADAAREGGLQF